MSVARSALPAELREAKLKRAREVEHRAHSVFTGVDAHATSTGTAKVRKKPRESETTVSRKQFGVHTG